MTTAIKKKKKLEIPVKEEKEEVEGKIKIKIKAYDHKIIDQAAKQIVDAVSRCDAKIVGPVPLPTEIKKFTVNRSTFIYKDSREQFEMRIFKRLIEILNPNPKVIEVLQNLNLSAGVDIEIKMV